jgi:hypothetical protein
MKRRFFKRESPNRLGRPPPATVQTTLKWLSSFRRKYKGRGSAPARQEGLPPAFTIASPRSIEDEAMVKAGGRKRSKDF